MITRANVHEVATVIHNTGRSHQLPVGEYVAVNIDGAYERGLVYLRDFNDNDALVCASLHDRNIEFVRDTGAGDG